MRDKEFEKLKALFFSGEPYDRVYIRSKLCGVFLSAFKELWNTDFCFTAFGIVYDRYAVRKIMIIDMSVDDLLCVYDKHKSDCKIPDKCIIALEILQVTLIRSALLSKAGEYYGHTFSNDVFRKRM